jgi:DNA/RNA-binding domain of Phe-tRNA-synthetase-like protein
MTTLTLVHDPLVAERFPAHSTAAVRVWADGPLSPVAGAIAQLAAQVAAPGGLDAARRAGAHWREVYDALGAKPKYQTSVQVLLEGYDERGAVPAPIPLVELYCWYSLARGVPMAGYRPEGLTGPLRLTVPGKGLPFTAIGHGNAQPERSKSGEVAYVDDEKVVCRYWNCRDCDQTKLTAGISGVLFVFDLVGEDPAEIVEGLVALLDGSPRTESGHADGRAAPEIRLG